MEVDIALQIKPGDEAAVPTGLSVADVKVLIRAVDRLFRTGSLSAVEALPVALARKRAADSIAGPKEAQ